MTMGPGDIIRAAAKMRWNGTDDIVNVFHLVATTVVGTPTQVEWRDAIVDYLETIYSNIIGDIANNVTFNTIELFNVSDDNPEAAASWQTLTAGSNADAVMGSDRAAFAYARTELSRRQGRKYFPPFTINANNDGFLTATVLGHVVDATSDWINEFVHAASGITFTPVIALSPPFLGTGWRPFLGAVVKSIWSGVDRRKQGVGS